MRIKSARVMRFILPILTIAIWWGWTTALPQDLNWARETFGASSNPIHTISNPEVEPPRLVPRAPRKCSPPGYGETHYKRNVELPMSDGVNASLWRRMRLPQDVANMETFMMSETGSGDAFPVVWNSQLWSEDEIPQDQVTDFNTASLEPFSRYTKAGDYEFSFATQQLKGCTVMAIISRKAVFIAHYWESIAFFPEEGSEKTAFRNTVSIPLKEGKGSQSRKQQDSLYHNKKLIDADDEIKGYLLIPSETLEGVEDPYRDAWERLKSEVGEILPKLKGPENWMEIKYLPKDDPKLLEETSAGRCLFKYDHNHNPNAEGVGRRRAVFWSEANAKAWHDDEWD